jgi:hypothetical protein
MPGAWPEDDALLNNATYNLLPSPRKTVSTRSAPWRTQKHDPALPFPTQAIHKLLSFTRVLLKPLSLLTRTVEQTKQTEEQAQEQGRPPIKDGEAFKAFFNLPAAIASSAGHTPGPRRVLEYYSPELMDISSPIYTPSRRKLLESDTPEHLITSSLRDTSVRRMPSHYTPEHIIRRRCKEAGLPDGWGRGGFDPADIIPTPIKNRKTQKSPKSPSKWSPYHYEHGLRRPAGSILRTSKPSHQRFESKILIQSPEKYIDEDYSPIDGDGDQEMMDADLPKKHVTIKIAKSSYSCINGDLLDGVNGAPKKFYKHIGIEAPLGPKFMSYRDTEPEFDPDESFIESSKPPGFDMEQEKSPSKDYVHVVDDALTHTISSWYQDVTQRQDPEEQMSKAMQARYAKAREERVLEEMRERHAKEQFIRDELAQKRKEEHERSMAVIRQREEEERLVEEAQAAEETAMAEMLAMERQEKERKRKAERTKQRAIIHGAFNPGHARYQEVETALDSLNPQEIVISKGQISRHDLGTLIPSGANDSASAWLNDNIVNTALSHLVTAANKRLGHNMAQKDKPAPFWCFNSGWYSTVLEKGGAGITRWAGKRGVNLNGTKLLGAKQLLFPVCLNNHWTVTVVNVEKRTLECLNSLNPLAGSNYNAQICKQIMKWLQFELGADFFAAEWISINGSTSKQGNGYDCGVFTIMNSISRIKGIESWAMREQVRDGTIGNSRWWIGSLLMNGGFDEDGIFGLHLEA